MNIAQKPKKIPKSFQKGELIMALMICGANLSNDQSCQKQCGLLKLNKKGYVKQEWLIRKISDEKGQLEMRIYRKVIAERNLRQIEKKIPPRMYKNWNRWRHERLFAPRQYK